MDCIDKKNDKVSKALEAAAKSAESNEAKGLLGVLSRAFGVGVKTINAKRDATKVIADDVYSNNLFSSMSVHNKDTGEYENGMYTGKQVNGNSTTLVGDELLKHIEVELGAGRFDDELDMTDPVVAAVDKLYMDGDEGFRKYLWEAIEPYAAEIDGKDGVMVPSKQGHLPVLNMLATFNKDGMELNDYVGRAVVVSAIQGLVNNSQGIYTIKVNNKDVEVETESAVDSSAVDIGVLGSDIGKLMMKNMGIKEASNEDTNALVYARLESSFGSLGVDILVRAGYLENPYKMYNSAGESVSIARNWKDNLQELNTYNTHLMGSMLSGKNVLYKYAKPPKGEDSRELLNELIDMSTAFDSVYGEDLGARRSYPAMEPKNPSKSVGVRGRDVPGAQLASTTILANQGMKFNSGLEELLPLMQSVEGRDKIVSKLLGKELARYKNAFVSGNESLLQELTYDQKKELEGKLQQITNVVGDFDSFLKDSDRDGTYYQDWFVAVQDRLHVGTTGLNYMADKHMARWVFSPEAWTKNADGSDYTVSKKGLDSTIEKFLYGDDSMFADITDKEMEYWAVADAIVQAFEGATIDGKKVQGVDKEHPRYSLDMARKILDSDVKVLRKQIMESDHIGHAALAVANVRKYQEGDGEFASDIYGEVDGKTNGVFHRLYQFGDKQFAKEFGSLVGVTGKSSKTLREQHSEEERAEDTYVKVGKDFSKYLGDLVGSVGWVGKFVSNAAMQGDDMAKLTKEKWSALRKDVKNPTMISMYGAGLKGLYMSFLDGVAAEVGKKAKTDPKGFEAELVKAGVHNAENLVKQIQWEVSYTSTKDLLNNPNSGMSMLFGSMLDTYLPNNEKGESFNKFSNVFNKHFEKQFELNNNITSLMEATYRTVSTMMQKDIDKQAATGKGMLNRKFLQGLMEKYKSLLPGMEGFGTAVSVGDNKLYFYKNKRSENSLDAGLDAKELPFYMPNYDGSTNGSQWAGIKTLNSDRFILSGPGVSFGPIGVQSLDSANLSLVVVEAQAKYGMTVMPMHDAIIRPPHMVATSMMFNRAGHEVNTSISYLENVITELESVQKVLKNVYSMEVLPISKYKKFAKGMEILAADKISNDELRQTMQKMDVYVAQMDGVPGSVYKVDGGAAFSSKEQVVNLQTMLVDEVSRQELMDRHKERLDAGEEVSLFDTANSLMETRVTKEASDELISMLENLGDTAGSKRELINIMAKVLEVEGKTAYNLDKLIKEFKEGCGL